MKTRTFPPQHLAALAGREAGTYVISTRCQCWGRGDTIDEAARNAKKAGARSLAPNNVVVYWQPDAAWQKIKAEYGDKTDARKPFIDEGGGLCSWGDGVETLHRPAKP